MQEPQVRLILPGWSVAVVQLRGDLPGVAQRHPRFYLLPPTLVVLVGLLVEVAAAYVAALVVPVIPAVVVELQGSVGPMAAAAAAVHI